MDSSNKVAQKELDFQKVLKEYKCNPCKETWDPLWPYVYDACLNIGKSKCYGIRVQNLEDKCLDATMKVMKKIKEEYKIKYSKYKISMFFWRSRKCRR